MAADILSAIPQLISAGADGASHEIQFSTEFNNLLGNKQVAFITVVSGTFKFNVGGDCSETNATYTAEKVEPLPFMNGTKNIFYQATTGGTFRISITEDDN